MLYFYATGYLSKFSVTTIKGGGLIIYLRVSIPIFYPEATFSYHAIVCGIARVMVTYVICTYPDTYANLEPKSCAKIIEQVPAQGWVFTTPQWKKEPL